jgi:hypothetical protein
MVGAPGGRGRWRWTSPCSSGGGCSRRGPARSGEDDCERSHGSDGAVIPWQRWHGHPISPPARAGGGPQPARSARHPARRPGARPPRVRSPPRPTRGPPRPARPGSAAWWLHRAGRVQCRGPGGVRRARRLEALLALIVGEACDPGAAAFAAYLRPQTAQHHAATGLVRHHHVQHHPAQHHAATGPPHPPPPRGYGSRQRPPRRGREPEIHRVDPESGSTLRLL